MSKGGLASGDPDLQGLLATCYLRDLLKFRSVSTASLRSIQGLIGRAKERGAVGGLALGPRDANAHRHCNARVAKND